MDSNKADVQLKKLLKRSNVPTVKKQEEVLLDQPGQSCKLEWSDKSYSREDIFSEYLNFLKHYPKLNTSEKKKILNTVRSKLRIKQIEENIGYSLRILAPPLDKCLMCREELTVNNKATQIVVFTLNGLELFSKYAVKAVHYVQKKSLSWRIIM